MTLPTAIQAARLKLLRSHPYLAAALLSLIPVEMPGLGTTAVDQWWRLYYDPSLSEIWSIDIISSVLYHEVLHLLRNHPERLRNFNPDLSNIAADAEINDDILREGLLLPNNSITPETIKQPKYLTAEEYYLSLTQQSEPEVTPSHGDAAGSQSGSDAGSRRGNPAGTLTASSDVGMSLPSGSSSSKPERTASSVSGSPSSLSDQPPVSLEGGKRDSQAQTPELEPRPAAGHCGSCATGRKAPWEKDVPNNSSEGIQESEAKLIIRTVAQAILSSASRGNVPEHLQRLAQEILSPKVDWRRVLASYVRRALSDVSGVSNYSYQRPSRRQSAVSGIILPSLRQPVPNVAVIVDTSGSMGNTQLAKAIAEIGGILKAVGKDGIHVLSVDTEVHTCQRVFQKDKINLIGGGGTDMRNGIKEALKLKPSVIIVITDGYTPWEERKINIPLIVALVGNGKAPSWAKVVKVED